MSLAWLSDRDDPRVKEALKHTCGICKQPPNSDCRHPWETREKLDRIVHRERAEWVHDKGSRKADGSA